MTKWIAYHVAIGFAVYWMSNLILWLPWSTNQWFGITLMLAVSPLIWAYSTFLCLRAFAKEMVLAGATYNNMIFLVLAALLDHIFFGLIRNAKNKLYQPTTFYGYGFVVSLPFIIALAFRRKLTMERRAVYRHDFVNALAFGLGGFGMHMVIIGADVKV